MSHGNSVVNTSTNAKLDAHCGATLRIAFFQIGGTQPMYRAGKIPAKTLFARTVTSLAVPFMSFTSLTGVSTASKSSHARGSVSSPTSLTRRPRIVRMRTLLIGDASMDE
eukprot:24097-Pelagococcus_subviridis.AAC.4